MAAPRRQSRENQFAKAQIDMVKPNLSTNGSEDRTDEPSEDKPGEPKKETKTAPNKPANSYEGVKKDKTTKRLADPTKSTHQVENIFSNIKPKVKGVQRSTYYNRDVFDFCDECAKQYGISYSDVVNMLLRKMICEMTKGEE